MLKEFVDKIAELGGGKILAAHGKSYSRDELHVLPSPYAEIKPLVVHTLAGLCDYVLADFDILRQRGAAGAAMGKDLGIVFDGPTRARLVSQLFGEFRQRDVLVDCVPFLSTPFRFGTFLAPQQFIVDVQACFVPSPTRAEVLALVGNLRSDTVGTWTDDGVTQEVTARKGIAGVERRAVPNPVRLAPYRTWHEIQQPESDYVLRVQRPDEDEEDMPTVALFEVADNRWQVAGMRYAVEFIRGYLEDIPIFC